MATKNWSKKTFTFLVLNDGAGAEWTDSTTTPGEYFYNTDDLNGLPLRVMEDGVDLTLGTLGSLAAGEYALGDNDTIGFDTIYVCLSDSAGDPDGSAAPVVECTDTYTILTGGAGTAVVIVGIAASNLSNGVKEVQSMAEDTIAENDVYALSYGGITLLSTAMDSTPTTVELLASLTGGDNADEYARMPFILSAGTNAITITWKLVGAVDDLCTAVKVAGTGTPAVTQTTKGTGDCDFVVYFTDSSDEVYYQFGLTLLVMDGPFALSAKYMLNDQDKIKVQSSLEEFTIMISGDES